MRSDTLACLGAICSQLVGCNELRLQPARIPDPEDPDDSHFGEPNVLMIVATDGRFGHQLVVSEKQRANAIFFAAAGFYLSSGIAEHRVAAMLRAKVGK